MELKNFFAQDLEGNFIPTPTVHLYEPGTTTHVSGLQDKDGLALANPFAGSATGQIQFAAPDGDYDLRVTGAGRDFTMRVRFIDSVAASAAILRSDLDDPDGSSIVGFEPAGSGAVARTVQDKLREIVSVTDYGAVPGGAVDSTAAFNLAVQSGARLVVVPAQTFLINPRHMLYNDGAYSQTTRVGVSIPSGVTLMMYGATLVSTDTDSDSYSLLASYRTSNVHINGGKLIGDKATNSSNPAVPADYGFGIDFRDVTDCSVEDVESNDMWGDSFYLGVTDTGGTGSKRVTYRNIKGSGSRRQGLSITGGEQITIDGWNFRSIRGAAAGPCAGIDIEPNTGDLVNDVIIKNGYAEDCNRPIQAFKCINLLIDGLQVENCDVLFPMVSDRVFDAVITNVIARGGANTNYGILWQNSLDISNVQVSNFSISGAALYAFYMDDTSGHPFSNVVFRDGVVFIKDAAVNTSYASAQSFGGVTFDSVRFVVPAGFDAADTVNLSPANTIFDGNNSIFTDCTVINSGTASLSFDCGQYGNRGNTFENIGTSRDLLSLQNDWVAASSHETPFVVKNRDGVVHVFGSISGGTGTSGTLLFTLPAGFRPSAQVLAPITVRAADASVSGKGVTIDSNGQVTLTDSTGNNRVGLSSITFVARA